MRARVIAVACLFLGAPALAQELEPYSRELTPVAPAPPQLPPADPRAHFQVLWDNDAFSVRKDWVSDRWYSNGARLGWMSPESPQGFAWLNDWFGPANTRWGFSLSQHIYTPTDKTLINPDPRDRPYAGYLYGTFSLERRGWNTLDRVELQVGVVGPAAFAEPLQNSIHDILKDQHGRGWAFQLKNEPTVNVNAERIWRVPLVTGPYAFGLDLLPSASVMVGNARTAAAVGTRVRIGQGLDRDFGPARIRPALGDGAPPVGDGFGWYVFAGAGGAAVARDIFVDGNTFVDSRRVTREPLVGDLEAGFALLFGGYRLSYTQVYRTREFVGQDRPFTYGSIGMNFAF
ncbi:MAG: lipid 3-O-deacylase [Variibacter sp.]|nr:lipid 3-O-deacylase [Variibacter sp.]